MTKILQKEIASKQYVFSISKESALKWDKWEKEFPTSVHEHLSSLFDSFIEYEFDLMFGAAIWVTVSNDSEIDSIAKFIEQII